jgi:hypothetical protein
VALAGHTDDLHTARLGLDDPAPAVRATALTALVRLGGLDTAGLIRAFADPAPEVRTRACELTARLWAPLPARPDAPAPPAGPADPPVVTHLCAALGDPAAVVAEAACFALGELGTLVPPGPAVTALAAVAGGHDDALVREAAVAALGAIGDPAGLPAILAATSDKPAVRRRAVLALAPFDGPEVDDALHRARSDRDWQVRQAAEDLTGP